ncbi:hypothetical protein [Vibrio parahaemolyticus]|nr:hypothetical protein [Vibrio parahaemolyticus]MCC4217164.1 hypothetical protein [Vibrio parahaemolyticus]HCG8628312.1 hypothetical protein [Vibrio parahaemolyticus]
MFRFFSRYSNYVDIVDIVDIVDSILEEFAAEQSLFIESCEIYPTH